MSGPVSGALLAALTLFGAQEPAGDAPEAAVPDRRIELDFEHYYAEDELGAALRSLSEAYPELLRLESMGTSRGGSELHVVTVGRHRGENLGRRPGLLLVGASGADDLAATELALFTIYALAQDNQRDQRVSELLDEAVLYVVPCANPDLRAAGLAALESDVPFPPPDVAVELDRNFPTGWDPAAHGVAAGPYPLSEPETRALVQFLVARPNIAIVQTFSGEAAGARDGSVPDSIAYEAVLARVGAGTGPVLDYPSLRRPGGGLLEFAVEELGAFTFRSDLARAPGEPGVPPVLELHDLGQRAYLSTLALADGFARVAVGQPVVTRLKNDYWQVDLTCRNDGVLPTGSALHADRSPVHRPLLRPEGGEVVAAALARGTGSYEVLPGSPSEVRVDYLRGGGEAQVRLVVRAPEETELSIELSAGRGGTSSARVVLR